MIVDASPSLYLKGSPFTELALTPDYTFTLTGSQYFGYARPESDWDFIAQFTPSCKVWLTSLGFTTKVDNTKKYQNDDEAVSGCTIEVVERVTSDAVVQVQLCSDAVRKIWVRDYIMRDPNILKAHATMSPRERGKLWQGLDAVLVHNPLMYLTPELV